MPRGKASSTRQLERLNKIEIVDIREVTVASTPLALTIVGVLSSDICIHSVKNFDTTADREYKVAATANTVTITADGAVTGDGVIALMVLRRQ